MHRFILLTVCIFLFAQKPVAHAEEVWKLVQLPAPFFAETKDKGAYIEFLKALSREAGVRFDIRLQPPRRSYHSLAKGRADMIVGYLEPENKRTLKELAGTLSDFNLMFVDFYIYSKKPLDSNALRMYTIEVMASHDDLFKTTFVQNACIMCSIKKLKAGRIDGYVSLDAIMDQLSKMEDLGRVHKVLYARLPIKILYRKDIPSSIKTHMKQAFIRTVKSGEYQRLLGELADPDIIKEYQDSDTP